MSPKHRPLEYAALDDLDPAIVVHNRLTYDLEHAAKWARLAAAAATLGAAWGEFKLALDDYADQREGQR